MDPLSTLALAAGLAWASGIRFYAVVFLLGAVHRAGIATLPPGLSLAAEPLVMGAAGFMFLVEFLADKFPGLDSLWDALHTFVRIPGGAALAALAVADSDPAFAVAAGLLGATLAASSHLTKAGSRALINASPEPFSNWVASAGEDALAVAVLWLALTHPLLTLVALAVFVLAALWALPRLVRGIRRLLAALPRLFRTG